jgi:ferredoxin-NADP reductase
MAVVQKIRCRVEEIADHGEHVYSVDLKPERLIPRFRPGQFLHLALDEYEPSSFWPESRVFSIASSPLQRDRISLSYSVRGRFTARMEKELNEGREVWVKMPYGEFVVQGNSEVVLIAGGTGITAFIAFLMGLTTQFPHQVCLGYGARSRELLIYRDRILEHAMRLPQFKSIFFIENNFLKPREASCSGDEFFGIISLEAMWSQIINPFRATFFLSGPPAMLKGMSKELRDRGISPEAIRIDAWE